MKTLVILGVLAVFVVVAYKLMFKKIKSYPSSNTTTVGGGSFTTGGGNAETIVNNKPVEFEQ